MAYLTTQGVQDWLSGRIAVGTIDADLESSAKNRAFGRLAVLYDTTAWTSDTTTPSLVLQAMAMLYASWFYNREYSEDGETTNIWADRLERMALELLDSIATGVISIPGTSPIGGEGILLNPAFFPTDTQDTDGLGNEIKFKMGAEF